jgi:hypothetical protein
VRDIPLRCRGAGSRVQVAGCRLLPVAEYHAFCGSSARRAYDQNGKRLSSYLVPQYPDDDTSNQPGVMSSLFLGWSDAPAHDGRTSPTWLSRRPCRASVRRGNSMRFPFSASVKALKRLQTLRGSNSAWAGSRLCLSACGICRLRRSILYPLRFSKTGAGSSLAISSTRYPKPGPLIVSRLISPPRLLKRPG